MSPSIIEHADGLPLPQRNWAILTIALGLVMAVMDGAIANVALPTIAQNLDASPAFSIWIVNGYQLAITISLLPLASLGEIIGYRRVYLAGLAAVHRGVAVLRAVAHAAAADGGAHRAGIRRGRDHERQRGAGALHLSARPARPRHRHQCAGGGDLRGGRTDRGGGHPGGRNLAVSVRRQHPVRHRGAGAGLALPAAHHARHATPSTGKAPRSARSPSASASPPSTAPAMARRRPSVCRNSPSRSSPACSWCCGRPT